MIKRHTVNAKDAAGRIIEREGKMHVSNVMLVCECERGAYRPQYLKTGASALPPLW
jgi:ribosomal protein L24